MKFDPKELHARVSVPLLMERAGLPMKSSGGRWTGECPARCGTSDGFTVEGETPWRGYCYKCGWGEKGGDVVEVYMALNGCAKGVAFEEVARLAGVSAGAAAPVKKHAAAVRVVKPLERLELPTGTRRLTDGERRALSCLRGVSVAAVEAAERAGVLAVTMWPRGEDGEPNSRSRLSWMVCDKSRAAAQFRPLNAKCACGWVGLLISPQCTQCGAGKGADGWRAVQYGPEQKTATAGSSKWPVGLAHRGERAVVWLTEGPGDMLAAFHILEALGEPDAVCVAAVLGASVRLHPDAVAALAGAVVIIFADMDAAGKKAALRWQEDLLGKGPAAVWVAQFEGAEGCKDLGDLVSSGRWSEYDFRALVTAGRAGA